MPVGVVSSAQKLYLNRTSQDPISMATTQRTPLLPPEPSHLDWHLEGSSSGERSFKAARLLSAQAPSGDLEVPQMPNTNAVVPNTVSTGNQMEQPLESNSSVVNQGRIHKLVRVPQSNSLLPVSLNQASSSSPTFPSTAAPNIDVDSSAKQAANPLALVSSSGSIRGNMLSVNHDEPQRLSDLQPSSLPFPSIDEDPALGLNFRHAQGVLEVASHHVSTLREVRAVNEPPTKVLAIQQETVSTVQSPRETPASTGLNFQTQPTVLPSNNETTTAEAYGAVVEGNRTDSTPVGELSANVTVFTELLSNSSSDKASGQGNISEAPSTASRNFLNRQVPGTTQEPWTRGNSSGPTVDSPPSRTPICLSRMDFVWIVLAISVPVSSCCK